MSDFLFGALNAVTSLLFSATDKLDLGTTLEEANIAVSSSGLTTNITIGGFTLAFPTLALSQASQAGNVTFSDGTHFMMGDASNDHLTGTPGNDAIYGMAGNDNIDAGGGHDYVFGGSGSDTISGGDGNDHLYGNAATTGDDGNDSISGGAGIDYIQGNAGSDTLDGGDGSDRLLGGQGDDVIYGGNGNDNINGNLGNDHIVGGSGDDVVRGGKGDDVISGGDGNDTIMGDLGADTMSGGAGHDVFQFHSNDAAVISTDLLLGHVDTITDFQIGTDHLALGFAPQAIHDGSASTIAGALTWATTALTGHGSDVATVEVGNDTYLFYSSSGGAVADSVIDLQGVHGLGLDSFL